MLWRPDLLLRSGDFFSHSFLFLHSADAESILVYSQISGFTLLLSISTCPHRLSFCVLCFQTSPRNLCPLKIPATYIQDVMQLPTVFACLLSLAPTALAAVGGRCTPAGGANSRSICVSTSVCRSYGGTYVNNKCPNDPADIKCCSVDNCLDSSSFCTWTGKLSFTLSSNLLQLLSFGSLTIEAASCEMELTDVDIQARIMSVRVSHNQYLSAGNVLEEITTSAVTTVLKWLSLCKSTLLGITSAVSLK